MKSHKTQEFEINAFQFYCDLMPDWFMDQLSSNNIILFNCNYSQYSDDEAFCVINVKNAGLRQVVSPGEYVIEGEWGELYKMHPDKFQTKYRKNK